MSFSALRRWWQALGGRSGRSLEADLPPSLWRPPHEDDIEPLAELPPELLRAGLVTLTRIHHAIADHHHRHPETPDHVYAAAVRCAEQRLLLTRDELRAARRIAVRIEEALDMAQRPRDAGARVAARYACRSVEHRLTSEPAVDGTLSMDSGVMGAGAIDAEAAVLDDAEPVDAEPADAEGRSVREPVARSQRGSRLALVDLGVLR